MKNKMDIKSFSYDELVKYIENLGEKKFRAKQIYEFIHKKRVATFDEMKNLPNSLIEKLKEDAILINLEIVTKKSSKLDNTSKYLFKLNDGNLIESVYMEYKHGVTACISSQVGCNMACTFCASTIDGLVRNLTAAEMLDQVIKIQEDSNKRVSNIVVMGSGEPLQNLDNLVRFLELVNDKNGLNISLRNITVSTCGLINKIKELEKYNLPITLAISLHAPNDEIRKKIMPVANYIKIKDLIKVCNEYEKTTKRRLTFEYALIKGVNSSLENALELSHLIKGLNAHVNIINVNPIKEKEYKKVQDIELKNFASVLEKNKINVTIRRELGQDIDASCGQLRRRYL